MIDPCTPSYIHKDTEGPLSRLITLIIIIIIIIAFTAVSLKELKFKHMMMAILGRNM
jgi:hypothetical protein